MPIRLLRSLLGFYQVWCLPLRKACLVFLREHCNAFFYLLIADKWGDVGGLRHPALILSPSRELLLLFGGCTVLSKKDKLKVGLPTASSPDNSIWLVWMFLENQSLLPSGFCPFAAVDCWSVAGKSLPWPGTWRSRSSENSFLSFVSGENKRARGHTLRDTLAESTDRLTGQQQIRQSQMFFFEADNSLACCKWLIGPGFPLCVAVLLWYPLLPWLKKSHTLGNSTGDVRHVTKICFGEQNVRFQLNKWTRTNHLHTSVLVSVQRALEWEMAQGRSMPGWKA